MSGYELDDHREVVSRRRNEDPPESHAAAARVKADRDRLSVLKTFSSRALTARQAALLAVEEGAGSARIDSLRRRVSDLKNLGWVTQTGRQDKQALFSITAAGRQQLWT